MAERGPWHAVVITCKTCLLQSMINHIRMAYVGRPDAFVEVVRMLCLQVSCAPPSGSPNRRSDEGNSNDNARHVST